MLQGLRHAAGAAARILPYPRSFLGLLLTAFTLVMLPLVGALAYSAWNTERLAGLSRSAVFNASQAARASRSLVDRIAAASALAASSMSLCFHDIRHVPMSGVHDAQ